MSVVDLVVVVAGRRRHREDRPRPGIEHDPGGPLRARRLHRLAQDRLDLGLDGRVERQRDVATGNGALELYGLERLTDRVVHDHLPPGLSGEDIVVLLLDPGEARAAEAAGARHLRVADDLRGEPVERVPARQLGNGRDAGQVLGHDAGGDLGLELAQDPAAAPLQLVLDRLHPPRPCGVRPVLLLLVVLRVMALLQLVIAESAGDDRRGVVRMLQPILVDHDRLRRLLLGQVLVVGAQDRPSQPWQGHDCALLRDGLSRKRGRVDDLDLRRPEHDDGEGRQRERQHEPQPAVRHLPHGAGRPPDDDFANRTCFVVVAFASTIPYSRALRLIAYEFDRLIVWFRRSPFCCSSCWT